jgi:hypothetical protein
MFWPLLLVAVPVLFVAALMSKARQSLLERQLAQERKPLEQAPVPAAPMVNVQVPLDFVPPITILVTDSRGHQLRVVVDERGQQHPEPVLNLN